MFLKLIKNQRYYCTNRKCSFITTPIFYVNAAPHIGHLYSAVIADAVHRFNKLASGKDAHCAFLFSTGTDEHGTKIQQAAAAHSIPVENYCQNISDRYRKLFHCFNIDYTRFIRTTEEDHTHAVQSFWNTLESNGSIYSAQYSGWYCIPDETFLTESQLKENERGEKVSIESGHRVEWTQETNFMFKLSKYHDDVHHWVKSCESRIQPTKFQKILLDYLEEPFPDISISRPKSRVPWGIDVPSDASQTVYVWLDALVNYLTVVGYPNADFIRSWPPTLQILGKDILKFHGIYWPAFLIAAGLEPPQKLLVHSHWTVDNQKMSKSKFNVVDPEERAASYTHEGIRFFLLREGVAHSDGNYNDTKILRILNAELADTLGNLLSRCCGKVLNPEGVVPSIDPEALKHLESLDVTKRVLELLHALPEKCFGHYRQFNFHFVVDSVVQLLHSTNNLFETTTPWKLKGPEHKAQLQAILGITMEVLRQTGIILQPIIPALCTQLLDKLNVRYERRYWNDLKVQWNERERPLGSTDAVLFRRIIVPKEPIREKKKNKKNV
ncbi:methionine--tRNA ligase, mitochondrial [Uranotaenia lowii]|uniref:methionine--tRNA ligase, mitochondrial n=1 Tax=Uranotaenia lowii TaxID=190385 RepID=UPI0024796A5F|nr:methionine--tRNA ligase, mitochondrial [Uranotaenia lowii]